MGLNRDNECAKMFIAAAAIMRGCEAKKKVTRTSQKLVCSVVANFPLWSNTFIEEDGYIYVFV